MMKKAVQLMKMVLLDLRRLQQKSLQLARSARGVQVFRRAYLKNVDQGTKRVRPVNDEKSWLLIYRK